MPEPSQSTLHLLQQALADGATVLAPSHSAARDLSFRFDQAQAAAGLAAWEPARIHAWSTWLQSQFSALVTAGVEARLLLNPAQEHMLWREIIAASPAHQPLSSLDSLADLARTAWTLAAQYDALDDLRRLGQTHDARTFADWAATFTRRCQQRLYVSPAQLPAVLREHLTHGTWTPPATLVLAAFDDHPPARAALLSALESSGCTLRPLTPSPAAPALHSVVRAANITEETHAAARWIRHFIENAPSDRTPRVALLVPSLEKERSTLDPMLREILAPELESISADLSSAPYTFSTAPPLAETAFARTALNLLRWAAEPLPIESISALLLSPYLGNTDSLAARAAFDASTLRRSQTLRPALGLNSFNRLPAQDPAVRNLFIAVAARAARLSSPRTPSATHADWMEFARDLLREAGFPGDRPLTAQEFNDARAWDHALDAIATLDFSGVRVDFATALAALQRQVHSSRAHGSSSALVQVMTPAEAAGSQFDAIVFLRATDAHWPAAERSNPLLGWALQLDRQMPGTDAARAASRAEQATSSLLASAPNVLFFYAAEGESGPQRLSPILQKLGLAEIAATTLVLPAPALPPIHLQTLEDRSPIPPLSSPTVRGGSLVLKLQAACGFRAFAELRLSATAPEPATLGLDARQTGNFVHEVLSLFWNDVQTQDNLRHMPTAHRAAKLQTAIDAAFARKVSPETAWDVAYLSVQKERLRSVLLQWLDRELLRGPFTVSASEQAQQINVGPLTLKLRMDRVDQVEGGTVLVDYKTGASSSPKDWAGDRPDDPQLPLYALHPDARNLRGIAFAKIRPGKDMKYLGFAEDPALLPHPTRMEHASLSEQVEAWRTVLVQLAQDFHDGKADVSPKEFPFTCTHCAQRLLCRLDIAALNAAEEDPEQADAE